MEMDSVILFDSLAVIVLHLTIAGKFALKVNTKAAELSKKGEQFSWKLFNSVEMVSMWIAHYIFSWVFMLIVPHLLKKGLGEKVFQEYSIYMDLIYPMVIGFASYYMAKAFRKRIATKIKL